MRNVGYLTCGRTSESDEVYTPFYAVEPIVKYILPSWTVWLPFDEPWSAFAQAFAERGYKTVRSHIAEGKDFFGYAPERFDCVVSNPPFSKKDAVLRRLYALGKPFAILLPLNSLQGKTRYECFKHGLQLLAFDRRIDYHTHDNFDSYTKGNQLRQRIFLQGHFTEGFDYRKAR